MFHSLKPPMSFLQSRYQIPHIKIRMRSHHQTRERDGVGNVAPDDAQGSEEVQKHTNYNVGESSLTLNFVDTGLPALDPSAVTKTRLLMSSRSTV